MAETSLEPSDELRPEQILPDLPGEEGDTPVVLSKPLSSEAQRLEKSLGRVAKTKRGREVIENIDQRYATEPTQNEAPTVKHEPTEDDPQKTKPASYNEETKPNAVINTESSDPNS